MPKDLVINNGKLDTTKLVGAPNVRQINYILNADAEVDTTGWATYADAAQATPVDGTGGTPQASLWTRSTTTPIRGVGSFRLDKTGSATRQGQGASYNFTIDKADQAKVLTVSFDYEVVSGTYATGDLTVYVYDVTNAQVIQPAGFSIPNVASGVQNKLIATFQTASNSTSYRLILHVASASTQNYTLAFDNVTVGPQTVQYGAPITDWVSYTPTFQGFGTPTSVEVQYRRVGDSVEVRGRFVTGTCTNVEARIGLPPGLTSSSTSINSITSAGSMWRGTATAGNGFVLLIEQARTYFTVAQFTNGAGALTKVNGSTNFSNSESQTFFGSCAVSGWGSYVVMSDTTDTRVVAASYTFTSGAQTSNDVFQNLPTPTILINTHGALNTTTGEFTVPVSGIYRSSCKVCFQTNATGLRAVRLLKNEENAIVGTGTLGSTSAEILNGADATTLVSCVAGDKLRWQAYQNSGANRNYSTTAGFNVVSFERISGPSSIAATESVVARYNGTTSTTLTNNTAMVWNTKVFDSHNGMSSGNYTVPVAGTYQVSVAGIVTNSASVGVAYNVYVNGNDRGNLFTSLNFTLAGSMLISCVGGDQISVRPTSNGTLLNSSLPNISIHRVGN